LEALAMESGRDLAVLKLRTFCSLVSSSSSSLDDSVEEESLSSLAVGCGGALLTKDGGLIGVLVFRENCRSSAIE
jgi:hypothetical protein